MSHGTEMGTYFVVYFIVQNVDPTGYVLDRYVIVNCDLFARLMLTIILSINKKKSALLKYNRL